MTSSSIPVVPHTTPLWVVSELLGAGSFAAVVVTMSGMVVGVVDASAVASAFELTPRRAIAAVPMRRTEIVEVDQLTEAMRHLAVGQCDALLCVCDDAAGWRLLLPEAA